MEQEVKERVPESVAERPKLQKMMVGKGYIWEYVMLTQNEHAAVARDFLERADAEFGAGDNLQASEKLWGAAAHAVLANIRKRGWSAGSHRLLNNAVRRLAEESGDDRLAVQFSVAEKFHFNFYHDAMEDWEREADRPIVRDFVTRALALL